MDDEPSKSGVREGVGLCDWLTTQHGHRGSWDTCSGLLTALPAHGQGLAEAVLFLRALQVTQTHRTVMFSNAGQRNLILQRKMLCEKGPSALLRAFQCSCLLCSWC